MARWKLSRPLSPLLLLSPFFLLTPCISGPAREPLLTGQPFLVLWGVPDEICMDRQDPTVFGMEQKDRVTVFDQDSLGLYPYFSNDGRPVNGGLPQYTSLDLHLQRVVRDMAWTQPQDPAAPGLGVLRWEEWAPQWSRNRGKQRKYLEESRVLLWGFFPNWSPEEVEKWAQVDFGAAAQSMLMETLRELNRFYPQRLWGLAPYPSCYSSDPAQMLLANYTGSCTAAEMALNDELMWLWKQSSALYPILSLEKLPAGTKGTWLYATDQIREALRLAALAGKSYDLPVFPLVNSVYTSSSTFLSQADLVNTVGESAAMGAAGVIIWERSSTAQTQKFCSELSFYVQEVLGPYVVNVTMATRLCGVLLCQGRGRCVRKNQKVPVYLHLPSSHSLLLPDVGEDIQAMDELPSAYLDVWRRDFQCHWFETMEVPAADQELVRSNIRDRRLNVRDYSPDVMDQRSNVRDQKLDVGFNIREDRLDVTDQRSLTTTNSVSDISEVTGVPMMPAGAVSFSHNVLIMLLSGLSFISLTDFDLNL
ncbi:glyco_hydro_56 domain-containing protein [Electrophorus electricus]|nr:glyco_hydro_56 domain-containing protein [Electrophorus electricus]